MAKQKISKSQAIRDFIAANPDVKDGKSIAEGASKLAGTNVDIGLVYSVKGPTKRRKKAQKSTDSSKMSKNEAQNELNMPALKAAATLLVAAGSRKAAQSALESVAAVQKLLAGDA